jgi:hypothetical protein
MNKIHYWGFPCNSNNTCTPAGKILKTWRGLNGDIVINVRLKDGSVLTYSPAKETKDIDKVTCKRCRRIFFNKLVAEPKCTCGPNKICLLHIGKA